MVSTFLKTLALFSLGDVLIENLVSLDRVAEYEVDLWGSEAKREQLTEEGARMAATIGMLSVTVEGEPLRFFPRSAWLCSGEGLKSELYPPRRCEEGSTGEEPHL